MKIDDDTKKFIKLRLENNAPEVEDLSPIELREMRASMAAVPPEHQVQIDNIKDIIIKSENRDIKLREYSNNNDDGTKEMVEYFFSQITAPLDANEKQQEVSLEVELQVAKEKIIEEYNYFKLRSSKVI